MADRKLRHFRFFCYDCKKHYRYLRTSRGDAMKEFHGFGHSNIKTDRMSRDLPKR